MKKKPVYEEKSRGGDHSLLRWAVDIVVVIALAFFVVMMFGSRVTVTGKSMEPTIRSDEVVLVNKLWYNFSVPERLDLVAFKKDDGSGKTYVKRIVGMPGETVQIVDGTLMINGEKAEFADSLNLSIPGLAEKEIKLKDNEYFVLGDNPETSEDSRFSEVGNVTGKQIIGKVWFRISPFTRLGLVK